jgi:hypothetical protein
MGPLSNEDMTIDKVLGCAAPLVFSDPKGDNPFFGGTCFRVKYRGRYYALTARHCIDNARVNLATTRVECAAPEHLYLPLRVWHRFDALEQGDTDRGDIVVFEVDRDSMYDHEIAQLPALDIVQLPAPSSDLKPGWRLLVEGYPFRLAEMDYDQRRWARPSEKLEARFEGPGVALGTSRLSLVRVTEILISMGSVALQYSRSRKSTLRPSGSVLRA